MASNIRRVIHQGRSAKARKNNKSGLLGAMQTGIGKWMSRITVRGHRYYLGYYYSPEDAHEAYMAAAKKYNVPLPK
jgi:hypothetical protein